MMEQEAVELEERVCELAATMCGITEHEMARERMRLMGALGGCGVGIDSVGLAADTACGSSWVTSSRMVPGIAARAGLG